MNKTEKVEGPAALIFPWQVGGVQGMWILWMMWILLTKPMQKFVTTVCLHCSFARLKNKHIGVLGTNVATISWLHWSPVSGYIVYPPLPMLISSTQVQLHCRVDCFTYRNLFQNEISDDFSSKSLLKLLIHSNAHIHNYRSRKKRWILELEIWFRL